MNGSHLDGSDQSKQNQIFSKEEYPVRIDARLRDRAKTALRKMQPGRGTAKPRLVSLREKIASLNKKIAKEISRPFPDSMRLQELKRQRLKVKENIHSLS